MVITERSWKPSYGNVPWVRIPLSAPHTKCCSFSAAFWEFNNINLLPMQKYSSWWRGAPAKGVGRETGARVRVSPSAPRKKHLRKQVLFSMISVPVGHGWYTLWYDIHSRGWYTLRVWRNGYYIIFSLNGNISYGKVVYHIATAIYHWRTQFFKFDFKKER